MLEINEITKVIGTKSVLDSISLSIPNGGSLAIVGESGSGKSTLARIVMALERPTSGGVQFNGCEAPYKGAAAFKDWYRQIQFVFQNTTASLDPRMTIAQSLEEPLSRFMDMGKNERKERIAEYAGKVGLPPHLLAGKPGRLSGGQYQRACIAKALIVKPKLLVCDEIVSNLDLLHQHQIIELLHTLKIEQRLSLLFITHDLSLVAGLCEEIAVLKEGQLVERFSSSAIHSPGHHPYTQSLLDAARSLGRAGM
ncbi:ABC transporter ATP-binding protein [Paenibacillus gorillae]|uniref:ABC transporter ATP-binding protein n=1 Tax=Paenibacillus gorillae TaxID=1243662 RepID=UPI0004AE3A9E|nr:dipeptide/oligopeptide/nickel ABC transporter ATP-binding protein [Paenibacillus gorillae]